MHSAASYEARSCEELRRIPFQWLKQKLILARALKRVKEPRHDVAGQLPITASGVRPLSGVLIRGNGWTVCSPRLVCRSLFCCSAGNAASAVVTVAPLRQRDGPTGGSSASGTAAERVVSFGLPAVRLRGSGRTQLCHRLHTCEHTLAFDSELSQSGMTAGVGNSPGAKTRSSGACPPGARSKFSLRFISDRKVQRMRLFRSSDKHRLLLTRARSKAHSLR